MRYFLAIIYTIVCLVNAMGFLPMDNFGSFGTFLFFAPLFAMPLLFGALTKLDTVFEADDRRSFITFMAAHYVLTAGAAIGTQIMSERSLALTMKMFEQYTASFVFGILWYLAGQAAIWAAFFASLRNKVT